jgi:Rhs element Vgr protein
MTHSDARAQTSSALIKIDGAMLPDQVFADVFDVTVEQDLVLPDTFALRIHDIDTRTQQGAQQLFPLADGTQFRIGREIEIWMGREDRPGQILTGEITALELDLRADGLPMLTVRGYDKSHRMHREKKTKVFMNVKISDIFSQIAGTHGLTALAEDTQVMYTQVFQDAQTDWEFVRRLAAMVGKEAHVRGSKLELRAAEVSGGPYQQEFGKTLHNVRLRLSASPQVASVEVRAWNPLTKTALVGVASTPAGTIARDQSKHGGQVASVFGTGKYLLTDQVVRTQQEAQQRAQAVLDEIGGNFIQFECECLGDARLKPGAQINLVGISRRFDGNYYVSSVTHRITPDRGYLTTVMVSGQQPNSLTSLMSSNGKRPGVPLNGRAHANYPGVVIGIVTNNKDPDMGGRVKVKFPWLADQLESDWARIAAPMAGAGRGFFWLPEIDDEVLVAFEHGDINRPYVVGGLWNGRDQPPSTAAQAVGPDGKVNQRIIKSRSGHVITIDDTAQSENISIVDKTGNNSIKLESPANKLTVTVNGDMVFEALQGNISVKGRTVALEATQGFTIKGLSVSAEATQAMTVKGMQTEVQATASMKVSGATTDVQAQAKLGLTGGAMTEVKGALIKLN